MVPGLAKTECNRNPCPPWAKRREGAHIDHHAAHPTSNNVANTTTLCHVTTAHKPAPTTVHNGTPRPRKLPTAHENTPATHVHLQWTRNNTPRTRNSTQRPRTPPAPTKRRPAPMPTPNAHNATPSGHDANEDDNMPGRRHAKTTTRRDDASTMRANETTPSPSPAAHHSFLSLLLTHYPPSPSPSLTPPPFLLTTPSLSLPPSFPTPSLHSLPPSFPTPCLHSLPPVFIPYPLSSFPHSLPTLSLTAPPFSSSPL
ncbi:uncharacterized protein LACBIDRAFT_330681 [Laccaria bicolor S238N-H82]|uniref:Predicted protein n=1 Tax=Laccaria bicolor (strain S238N-H82 / ATCC MYA-4686) TaxID=486041 RepID=B0DM42_LACBS|nr:uncharacterized protein LACBIDRAFT_330681 [Laccaria bicolor S238N-H82]EDR04406.1 predicted protein [Laccaria bicolor S238N-H82]|eukprot:XP_001884925.1 predicted protein [Laccaria bicolor S238N-H82]